MSDQVGTPKTGFLTTRLKCLFQVHFASATVIDGGESFAGRAGRVSKEYEGMGFSRMSTEHMQEWAKKRGVYRKVNVASESNLADVTKPSFKMIHKHILTKVIV